MDNHLLRDNSLLDLKIAAIIIILHLIPMGACLAPREYRRQDGPPTEPPKAEEKMLCHICMNHIPKSHFFTLTCGHAFGKDCLAEAYTLKIR
jgi:hypothetical protein